jgi:hypothetical protein
MTVLLTAEIPARTTLARLEVRNKTDKYVKISLNGDGNFYFLTINPYTTKIFTVARTTYAQTTFVCGASLSGVLDMTTNVRLVFPPCNSKNIFDPGTPTIEKIQSNSSPYGRMWRYWQFK